jgi:hypothetical protein
LGVDRLGRMETHWEGLAEFTTEMSGSSEVPTAMWGWQQRTAGMGERGLRGGVGTAAQ